MKKNPATKTAQKVVVSSLPARSGNYNWIYLIIIILTGVLAYSNSFDCSFHFDDMQNIRDNKVIRNFDLAALWDYSHNRFLPFVSFALNYHFSRLDLWGFHFFNLLIHLLTAVAVFVLVKVVFETPAMKANSMQSQKNSIAFFAALLFVSHPLATQSIIYIVQRMASMVALFYLWSLFFYVKARITKNSMALAYYAAAVLTGMATLVSKENGYTLPLAIGLVELAFFREVQLKSLFQKQAFWIVMIVLAGFGVFILTQFGSAIKTRTPEFTNEFREITPLSYLFTQLTIIPKYIQLLFLPINQNLDYDWPLYKSLLQWQVIMGLLINAGILGLAVYQWNRNRIYAFGIIFFYLALLVESSIVPIDDLIFEHRTYLPSFGFFLIVSVLLHRAFQHAGAPLKYGTFALITVLLTMASFSRNKVWKTELTLSRDRIAKSPGKGRSHVALAGSLYESITDINDVAGNAAALEEAKEHAIEAIRLWPTDGGPRQSLGIYYYFMGKYDSAYYYQAPTIKNDNQNMEYRQNLLKTLNKLKRYDEAIEQARIVLKNDSTNEVALFGMALAYTNQGKLNEGLSWFLKFYEVNPYRKDVLNYISQIYKALGKTEEARQFEIRAGEIE